MVICDGKLDNGTTCAASLTSGQKFCFLCGNKVDPQLFQSQKKTCTQCGMTLDSICVFCPECGTKKVNLQKTDQDQIKTIPSQIVSNQPSQDLAPTPKAGSPTTVEGTESLNQDDCNRDTHEGDIQTHLSETSRETERAQLSKFADIPESIAAPTNDTKHNRDVTIEETESVEFTTPLDLDKLSVEGDNSVNVKDRSENLNILAAHGNHQNNKPISSTTEATKQKHPDFDKASAAIKQGTYIQNIVITEKITENNTSIRNLETENLASTDNGQENKPTNKSEKEVEYEETNKSLTTEEGTFEKMSLYSGTDGDSNSDWDDIEVESNGNVNEKDAIKNEKRKKRPLHVKKKNKKQQKREENYKIKKHGQVVSPESPDSMKSGNTAKGESSKKSVITKTEKLTDETDTKKQSNKKVKDTNQTDKPATSTSQEHVLGMGKPTHIPIKGAAEEISKTLSSRYPDTEKGDKGEPEKTDGKTRDIKDNSNAVFETDVDTGMTTRATTKQLEETENKQDKTRKEIEYMNQKGKNKNIGPEKKVNKSSRTYQVDHVYEPKVNVHFHVLVPEEFKYNPSTDQVILRLGDTHDGWNSDKWKMKLTKQHSCGMAEMEIEVDIKKRLITNSSLMYKYYIKRKNKEARDNLWEYYFRDGNAGPGVNRNLYIPDRLKSKDCWHQYDGVMVREPKAGLYSAAKDYFSRKRKFVKDAELSVELFGGKLLEMITEDNLNVHAISEAVEMSEQLMHGMRRVYVLDGRCWDSEDKMMKELGHSLLAPIVMHVEGLVNCSKPESDYQLEKRLIVTFVLLSIMKKLSIPDFKIDTKLRRKICRSLLPTPDKDRKSCKEFDFIIKHFSEKKAFFKDALMLFGKSIVGSSKDPTWMFLLPLIHFLSGACRPFEEKSPDTNHDSKVPVWWGVSHIGEDTIKLLKKTKLRWEVSMDDILETLVPLFEMDYFLPRSIMACLQLSEVHAMILKKKIPIEVCCGSLVFYIKETPSFSFGSPSSESKIILACINEVVKQSQEIFSPEKGKDVNTWLLSMKLSSDLFVVAVKTDLNLTTSNSAQLFVHCAAIYMNTIQKTTDKDKVTELVMEINNKLLRWLELKHINWRHSMASALMTWDVAVAPEQLQSEEVRDMWNTRLIEKLNKNLIHSSVTSDPNITKDFVTHYCQQLDSYKPAMQKCLSEIAFKAIEGAYGLDINSFSEYEQKRFGILLSKMFDQEWNSVIKNVTNKTEEKILWHTLTWSPYVQFLKARYNKKQNKLLSGDCQLNLVKVISIVEDRYDALLTGEITIGNLSMLEAHLERFCELAEFIKEDSQGKKGIRQYIKLACKVRQKELKSFHEQGDMVRTLTSLCQHIIGVDVSELDSVLVQDLDEYSLSKFCKPTDVTKIQDINSFKPVLTAFKVPNDVLLILPQLHFCYDSLVFMKFWEARCIEQDDNCRTLEDVSEHICKPVLTRWTQTAQRIKNGDIKFQEMEKLIGHAFKEDYEQMKYEMRALQLEMPVINKRVDQLRKHRQLGAFVSGARVILKFATEYQLEGDFQQIRNLASHGHHNFAMKSFNESMMDTCDFLKDLTKSKVNCLDAFVECGRLVAWLKESMKNAGLKELKVFVDLAFMSVGDDTLNIKLVQCLHSAVTGYAPLIFDLKPSAGYKKLMEHCSVVWKELDANPELPKKLAETNRNLQWLQEIKKAHGSVEVTSLVQADAINSHGLFTVGKNAKQKQETMPDIQSIFRLVVPEDKAEGKRKMRDYTFKQLQDLQSRLMLVAGKAERGNANVERFTMIFDAIIRLSNVCIKLSSAGCVLFKDWTAKFLCDPTRPVCAILQFGTGTNVPTLKGRTTKEEQLQDIIPKLANFMENCLTNWLEYIKDKRRNYLHLNYFTVDQLVILQREFVKIGTDAEASVKIYPLLSAVKESCTPADLLEAMTFAQQELAHNEVIEEASGEAEATVDVTEEDNVQTFILELINAGFDETLAVKAAEHHTPDQVTEGIIWCMNREEENVLEMDTDWTNHSTVVDKGEEPVHRPAFSGWSQSDRSIQSVITSNIASLSGSNGYMYILPPPPEKNTKGSPCYVNMHKGVKLSFSLRR